MLSSGNIYEWRFKNIWHIAHETTRKHLNEDAAQDRILSEGRPLEPAQHIIIYLFPSLLDPSVNLTILQSCTVGLKGGHLAYFHVKMKMCINSFYISSIS